MISGIDDTIFNFLNRQIFGCRVQQRNGLFLTVTGTVRVALFLSFCSFAFFIAAEFIRKIFGSFLFLFGFFLCLFPRNGIGLFF